MSSTMRSNSSPSTSTSTTTIADPSGFKHLNSPIPYLFGGLALMLVLIAMALIILAWSYRKHGDDDAGDEESKAAAKKVEEVEEDHEPKIVVIMPGNHNPTYLAKPKPKPVLNIVHGDEQV